MMKKMSIGLLSGVAACGISIVAAPAATAAVWPVGPDFPNKTECMDEGFDRFGEINIQNYWNCTENDDGTWWLWTDDGLTD